MQRHYANFHNARSRALRSAWLISAARGCAAQAPNISWMLIYLNAALESWETVNHGFPDAGSLGPDDDSIDGRRLTHAPQDDSEATTVAGTIYLLILVAAFIGIVIWVFGRKRKARFEADARIPLNDNKDDQP